MVDARDRRHCAVRPKLPQHRSCAVVGGRVARSPSQKRWSLPVYLIELGCESLRSLAAGAMISSVRKSSSCPSEQSRPVAPARLASRADSSSERWPVVFENHPEGDGSGRLFFEIRLLRRADFEPGDPFPRGSSVRANVMAESVAWRGAHGDRCSLTLVARATSTALALGGTTVLMRASERSGRTGCRLAMGDLRIGCLPQSVWVTRAS